MATRNTSQTLALRNRWNNASISRAKHEALALASSGRSASWAVARKTVLLADFRPVPQLTERLKEAKDPAVAL